MDRDCPHLSPPFLSLLPPLPHFKSSGWGKKQRKEGKVFGVRKPFQFSFWCGRVCVVWETKNCPRESKSPGFYSWLSSFTPEYKWLNPSGPQVPDLFNGPKMFALADLVWGRYLTPGKYSNAVGLPVVCWEVVEVVAGGRRRRLPLASPQVKYQKNVLGALLFTGHTFWKGITWSQLKMSDDTSLFRDLSIIIWVHSLNQDVIEILKDFFRYTKFTL